MDTRRLSPASHLALLPPAEREAFLAQLSPEEAASLEYDWAGLWARPSQRPPPAPWKVWLILSGRGWGKTRVGAEQVLALGADARAADCPRRGDGGRRAGCGCGRRKRSARVLSALVYAAVPAHQTPPDLAEWDDRDHVQRGRARTAQRPPASVCLVR